MEGRIAAVIPARMASSRFPGKPLLRLRGLPMVEHVRRRAILSEAFCDVVVATCDPEIAEAVLGYGGRVIMTSASHPGATDRVAEASTHLDCTHVVNVQGDEILVLPGDLATMARAIQAAPGVSAWNAVARIESPEELSDRSIVKCAVSSSGRLLFCGRDFSWLPFHDGAYEPMRKVLGILAYRRSFLRSLERLARTPLEELESIDQSRLIEHDVVVQGVDWDRGYMGINEPRDMDIVEGCFDDDGDQRAVLDRLLAL